ncbi:hypothetical protein GCM10028799_31460 [Kribbella italica]
MLKVARDVGAAVAGGVAGVYGGREVRRGRRGWQAGGVGRALAGVLEVGAEAGAAVQVRARQAGWGDCFQGLGG